MSVMDRRDFVKSLSVAVGTAALAGVTPLGSAQEKAGGGKPVGAKTMYDVFALKYAGPFDRKLAMVLFNNGWAEDISIYYYIWAIRKKATGKPRWWTRAPATPGPRNAMLRAMCRPRLWSHG